MSETLLILVALLLPVAAWSGYRIGRRNREDRGREGKASSLSRSYILGLNYLLNEQADKAIDTFIDMLKVDSETVETHLALGNLFRKRGEVDRAIRIHQNIIARPALRQGHRNSALMELGHDYMAAGLFDRAESLFQELLQDPEHKQESLKQLLMIHQQTKDWLKAAEVAEQFQGSTGEDQSKPIGHFYCELSRQQRLAGDLKSALQTLKKALQIDPRSVRASLAQGRMQMELGHYKAALKSFARVEDQDVSFLSEALPEIIECYEQLGDKKGYREFLHHGLDKGAGVSIMLALAEEIRKTRDDREAAVFIGNYLSNRPSLKGLSRLIDMHVEHAQSSARPSLEMLKSIVEKLLQRKPVYACNVCGLSGKVLYWQCPSCKSWSSTRPIQGLEGE